AFIDQVQLFESRREWVIRELQVEWTVTKLRSAAAPGKADALAQFVCALVTVHSIMQIDQPAAARKESIQLRRTLSGPPWIVGVEYDDIGILELLCFWPAKSSTDVNVVGE